jgi:hypothetical protein
LKSSLISWSICMVHPLRLVPTIATLLYAGRTGEKKEPASSVADKT